MKERNVIVNELFNRDILVDPEVVDYIIENGGTLYLEEFIKKFGHLGYIAKEDVLSDTSNINRANTGVMSAPENTGGKEVDHNGKILNKEHTKPPNKVENMDSSLELEKSKKVRVIGSSTPKWDFKVIMDASKNMSASGSADDFTKLFLDRYRRISAMIARKVMMKGATSIDRMREGEVKIVGMIMDIRTTQKGKIIFELEDPTGRIKCLYSGKEILLKDEVIGVIGTYRRGKDIVYVNEIVKPDVAWSRKNRKIKEEIGVAIISDVHVGSKTFLDRKWKKFLEWLKGNEDGARSIEYLIIAGDLEDGIGVYPNQEEELEILDIFEQYEALAEYLKEIPDRIKAIMIPGNHDIVRVAEPQPAIPESIQKMFDSHSEFLSNPSVFSIHGYKFLTYHGASLNNLVELIPGMDYTNTGKMMEYMLRVRHLSPVYGEKVPVVPLPRDFLVIEDTPDVLVTGHVHTFSYDIYKGIHLINASTWQEQTKYQKMMNFNPDPAKVAILWLNRDEVQVKRF